MQTIVTKQIVYVVIKSSKYMCDAYRVVKCQIYTVKGDVKHHLIGIVYYDMHTAEPLDILYECDIHTTKSTKKHLLSKYHHN
jgi:hypothetical protein